jgi:CelD/BcsL family acetyltransferase involved in cellulose biosynthesis
VAASAESLALDAPDWTAFVESRADAGPFHHPAWARMLADCYRFRAFGLAVRDEAGAVRAGLPAMEVGGRLRGRRWVSLPFTDHCAPLADGEDLVGVLDATRREAGVDAIEVRATLAGEGAWYAPQGHRHVLALDRGADEVLAGLHRSTRSSIKRAARDGVVVAPIETLTELDRAFYRLHLVTRRRLGVPVQPRRFFELVWERMLEPGHGFALGAYKDDVPVAASIFLGWNRHVVYKYSASADEHRRLRGPHAILDAAVRRACDEGAATFDFGRTEVGNEGLREFKLSWGTEETQLSYTTLADKPPPDGSDGRALRALGAVIRRSPPWVARAIGEVAYRYTA